MIETDLLLDGIARTLETRVLPALDSGFARGQLFAVLEVLGNLQGRLVWGGVLLESEAASLAGLLERAHELGCGALDSRLLAYAAGQASMPLAERVAEGRELVCALIDGGHADAGPMAEAIDEYLRNDAIFHAMALRPTRLAEISQG